VVKSDEELLQTIHHSNFGSIRLLSLEGEG